jgi:tRNA wybutosine-synthesizing protein 3
MEELAQKIEEGKVDPYMLEIISIINSSDDYYTTSSCSGRMQLIALPKLGDKPGSTVCGKWHDTIEMEQLKEALENWDGKDMLMLLVQSPVLHVVCRDLESAVKIRNIGSESGFKYSTIRSIQEGSTDEGDEKNIIVELLSTERLDIPIGKEGKVFPDDEYLDYILELSTQAMERSRGKLARLKENLDSNFG